MIVTRVTNSMMKNTLLSNLNLNLQSVERYQNQLSTGRKYGHISEDPAALIYGQAARNKLARLSHFAETVGTARNWLTQAESGIMELQGTMQSVYEELVNAGGPKTISDREIIGKNLDQLRKHYIDTLNSSYGDRFVFSGYNTPGDYVQNKPVEIKPFTFDTNGNLLFNGFNVSQFDGIPAAFLHTTNEAEWENFVLGMTDSDGVQLYPGGIDDFVAEHGGWADADEFKAEVHKMHRLMNDVISFDVGPGISMPVTINGLDILFFTTQDGDGNAIMRNMYELLNEVHDSVVGTRLNADGLPITVSDGDEITGLTNLIKLVQDGQESLLVKTADIGGRDRRLDLLEARYESDDINYETMRSNAEDADIAEVIMYLRMAETVYQAALSAGARVIQPTLMDFLR